MALVIPESTKEITVAAKEQSNQESFILYEQYKDSIKQSIANEEDNEGLTKVGIVLSFLLDSYAPKEQNRIIEYYQGFLLAVNRLKQEGYSFEINAYDAGKKDESIDSLLSSGMLDDMDLIIGATYTKHNKQLADFAKKNPEVVSKFIDGALQASELYDTDLDTIKKVMPMFSTASDKDIKENCVVAKLTTTASDGKIYQVDSGAYVHKNGISCTYLAKYI